MVQFDIAEVQPNKLPKLSMVLVGAELGLRGSTGGQGSLSLPGSSRPERGARLLSDPWFLKMFVEGSHRFLCCASCLSTWCVSVYLTVYTTAHWCLAVLPSPSSLYLSDSYCCWYWNSVDTSVSLVCYFGCKALGLWLVLYFWSIFCSGHCLC